MALRHTVFVRAGCVLEQDTKKIAYPIPQTSSAASSGCRSRLSDNARKLFDLAMQSHEFKNMMVSCVCVCIY